MLRFIGRRTTGITILDETKPINPQTSLNAECQGQGGALMLGAMADA